MAVGGTVARSSARLCASARALHAHNYIYTGICCARGGPMCARARGTLETRGRRTLMKSVDSIESYGSTGSTGSTVQYAVPVHTDLHENFLQWLSNTLRNQNQTNLHTPGIRPGVCRMGMPCVPVASIISED